MNTPPSLSLEKQFSFKSRLKKQVFLRLLFTLVSLSILIWFYQSEWSAIKYAFSSNSPLISMGNVIHIKPETLKNNAYIEFTGTIEHRGLSQKRFQLKNFQRQEYWFFRLLGAQGLFLLTPPDKNRFGPTHRVTVKGRIIDPSKDHNYDTLLQRYYSIYPAQRHKSLRILLVDQAPGQNKFIYLLFIGLTIIGVFLIFKRTYWLYRQNTKHQIIGKKPKPR